MDRSYVWGPTSCAPSERAAAVPSTDVKHVEAIFFFCSWLLRPRKVRLFFLRSRVCASVASTEARISPLRPHAAAGTLAQTARKTTCRSAPRIEKIIEIMLTTEKTDRDDNRDHVSNQENPFLQRLSNRSRLAFFLSADFSKESHVWNRSPIPAWSRSFWKDLYDLAHVIGWEPDDLYHQTHVYWVRHVLYFCTTDPPHLKTAGTGFTVDDLDGRYDPHDLDGELFKVCQESIAIDFRKIFNNVVSAVSGRWESLHYYSTSGFWTRLVVIEAHVKKKTTTKVESLL